MKNMKQLFCSLVAFCVLAINGWAQQEADTLHHVNSWNEALQEAQQKNKLLFVDCYFTGCYPCAQMDKEVFPNELVKKTLNEHFIGIKIDVFKEKLGDTINLKYGISGYPTYLILNARGQLISQFNGYKDPGLLLQELNNAIALVKKQQYLTGFSASLEISYPDFYVKYYDRKDRKSDPVAANAWIKSQKDWTSEPVAMAIFKTRPLDTEVGDYLLNNYPAYRAKYGESLVLNKVSDQLIDRMKKMMEGGASETQFRKFIAEQSPRFPAADWKIMNFMLGYHYYGSMQKDTMKLLEFVNEDPLVHVNYMGALYSMMMGRKQLNASNLSLLCKWADKAVNQECAIDMIRTAAYMHKNNKDMEGFRRYINMAIAKSKRYQMPVEQLEKLN